MPGSPIPHKCHTGGERRVQLVTAPIKPHKASASPLDALEVFLGGHTQPLARIGKGECMGVGGGGLWGLGAPQGSSCPAGMGAGGIAEWDPPMAAPNPARWGTKAPPVPSKGGHIGSLLPVGHQGHGLARQGVTGGWGGDPHPAQTPGSDSGVGGVKLHPMAGAGGGTSEVAGHEPPRGYKYPGETSSRATTPIPTPPQNTQGGWGSPHPAVDTPMQTRPQHHPQTQQQPTPNPQPRPTLPAQKRVVEPNPEHGAPWLPWARGFGGSPCIRRPWR